jgi:hypothetical protein
LKKFVVFLQIFDLGTSLFLQISVFTNSGGKSVMFWGCISLNAFGPLVEVRDKNTAETYIQTLMPELAAAPGHMVFQQDNAAIHKTAAVLTFMAENNVETFEWRPRSHARMRDACLEIWGNLENHIREHLVQTVRERLVKCLAANGDIIKF